MRFFAAPLVYPVGGGAFSGAHPQRSTAKPETRKQRYRRVSRKSGLSCAPAPYLPGKKRYRPKSFPRSVPFRQKTRTKRNFSVCTPPSPCRKHRVRRMPPPSPPRLWQLSVTTSPLWSISPKYKNRNQPFCEIRFGSRAIAASVVSRKRVSLRPDAFEGGSCCFSSAFPLHKPRGSFSTFSLLCYPIIIYT